MTVPGPYGDQTTDAILAAQGYVPAQQGEFLGRILDPVREAALASAVDLLRDERATVDAVVTVAKAFEEYLDPPEETLT
jgi:hypothetical protein